MYFLILMEQFVVKVEKLQKEIAVSYTHLDVYKRQTLGCPVIAIGVPTVIYASSIVKDVFQLMKDYFGDAIDIKNRLKIGKREKYEGTLSSSQQLSLIHIYFLIASKIFIR